MDDLYLFGRFGLLVLLAVGIAFIVLARWLQIRARRVASAAVAWPTVAGAVTHSRLITEAASAGGQYRKTRSYLVRYTYVVDGRALKGAMRSMDRKLWPELQTRFTVRGSVDVRYDPARPRRSTLDLRFLDAGKSLATVLYVLGGVLVVAALYGFALTSGRGTPTVLSSSASSVRWFPGQSAPAGS